MTRPEARTPVGRVAEVWRYPVKSMQGERLGQSVIGPDGVEGDRRFAVVDRATGRVASAKTPKKWAGLLGLRAELRGEVLVVTAPEGAEYRADRHDLGAELSRLLGRPVALASAPPAGAAIEVEWPAVDGLASAGTASVEGLAPGSYFDLAPLHLLTAATLRRFRELVPGGDFDPRRFRPNLLIDTAPELTGFVETAWVGRGLVVGGVRLGVTALCSRCVMTTLAQPGLPADLRVLRAAVEHGGAAVGVYASAREAGEIAVGAPVWLE